MAENDILDVSLYKHTIIPNYKKCFTDSALKECEYDLNKRTREPICWPGGYGVVFKFINKSTKGEFAVKCFREIYAKSTQLRNRYEKIFEYFATIKLPFLIDFEFLPQGIWIKERYPILKMPFVKNGKKLDEYITDIINDRNSIENLIQKFKSMIVELQNNNIAHGDLQHGNIFVLQNGDLRLIDYDGVYFPGLGDNIVETECGLPAYQHPDRNPESERILNEKIDNFSALVILTTFHAYRSNPKLCNKFPPGDWHLFFKGSDFSDPNNSECFNELLKSSDTEVKRLTLILKESCIRSFEQIPEFKEVIDPNFTPEEYRRRQPILLPQPPIFISPSLDEKISSLRPTLKVQPILNASEYHFRIFEKGGNLVREKSLNSPSWSMDIDLNNGVNYECDCRVKIRRIPSSYSARQNFTVFVPPRPYEPIPISPIRRKRVITLRPTLQVQHVTDAIQYYFRIYKYGSLYDSGFSNSNLWIPNRTLDNDAPYEWDCQVQNIAEWGPVCSRSSFVIRKIKITPLLISTAIVLIVFLVIFIGISENRAVKKERYNKVVQLIDNLNYYDAGVLLNEYRTKKLLPENKIYELEIKNKEIHPDILAGRNDENSLKITLREFDKLIYSWGKNVDYVIRNKGRNPYLDLDGKKYTGREAISKCIEVTENYKEKRKNVEKKLIDNGLKATAEHPDNIYILATKASGEKKKQLLQQAEREYEKLKDFYYKKCEENEEIIGLANPLLSFPNKISEWENSSYSCVRTDPIYLKKLKEYIGKLNKTKNELDVNVWTDEEMKETLVQKITGDQIIEDKKEEKRHIYKSGRRNFTAERIHDLEEIHPTETPLRVCWQTGTPGSHCTGGTAWFYISANRSDWTLLGSEDYPERKGRDDIIHTSIFYPETPFRYVKVYIPNNYCDFSSAEVNWSDVEQYQEKKKQETNEITIQKKRHIYKSGRRNFTVERIHDLEELHPVGTYLRICWQTGTPGSHCTGGYASFYISSDGSNWTLIGSEYYPERRGKGDIIHTSLFNPKYSFRYVKVSIPNNYCDFSSAEVRWEEYCPYCKKIRVKDEVVCSHCGYEYECAICNKKRESPAEKVCSHCGYEYNK